MLTYDGSKLTHKWYIHGKLASLNTGLEPTTTRKNQVTALFDNAISAFGTDIANYFCEGVSCINFNNIF